MAPPRERGFEHKRVRVTAVDLEHSLALVKDRLGKEEQVTLTVNRTGMTPTEGETWLIDRMYGPWTFGARVGPAQP